MENNASIESRRRLLKNGLASIAGLTGSAILSGCRGIKFTIGGYEHTNFKGTEYEGFILERAQELGNSKKPEDWRDAAKHYGSIGRLEEMDECAKKYAIAEPQIGLYLLDTCQIIKKFYKKKHRKFIFF